MGGLLGFVAWSLIEIALFVTVGSWIGVAGPLLVVLGTGVAGVWILRRQGMALGAAMSRRGGLSPVAHSGLVGIAGVLLILPGFLTDLLGLLLLVPPVRSLIIATVGSRIKATVIHTQAMRPRDDGDVLDLTAIEVDHNSPREPSGWTKP